MLTENYIFDALQAESEGVECPIEFDVVEHSYGFAKKTKAKQLVISALEDISDGVDLGDCGFQTAPKYQLGKNNKLFLSVKAYKFSLARARTSRGAEYLLYLLTIEERYLAGLNRLLEATVEPFVIPDGTSFIFSVQQVHQWSGYATLNYTIKVIKEDYTEDVDYIVVENQIMLNADAALILLNAARPAIGCTTIPEELKQYKYPWDKAQQNRLNKINRRRSQKPAVDCGCKQLSLF